MIECQEGDKQMLNIEDLKVGDKIEFINRESEEEFLKLDKCNDYVINSCFKDGECTIEFIDSPIGELRLFVVNYYQPFCTILEKELKYFRKVETKEDLDDKIEENTALVNAGVKSIKEMYKRLLEGEVLYYENEKFTFDGDDFVRDYWLLIRGQEIDLTLLEVQKQWYEFASEENPILCKVWDREGEVYYQMITEYRKSDKYYPFIGKGIWKNATPVKPSECFQGG